MKTPLALVIGIVLGGMPACGNLDGHMVGGAAPPAADGGIEAPPAADGGRVPAVPALPPPPTAAHPACALSADCPVGTHCDLGECMQACSAAAPCPVGTSVCSPRGRCLEAGETDADPAPVTASAGTAKADPGRVPLSDRDRELRIHLLATSRDPVRYRVAFDAPYLSVDEDRGEFLGETILRIHVDRAKVAAHEVTGSVHVFTTLGDVVVPAPIRAGLTARYEGELTYDGAASGSSLGTTRIDVSLAEHNGSLSAAIDPAHSLLFPAGADGAPVSGYGSYTETDGVTLTVKQIVPADLGGGENPFRRPIGRSVRFDLTPGEQGELDGTFAETLIGLFEAPIVLTGHVHLERVACGKTATDCEPQVGAPRPDPIMPTVDPKAAPDLGSLFPGASSTAYVGDGISVGRTIDLVYHQPFVDRLAKAALSSTEPLSALVEDCRADLAAGQSASPRCASTAPIACALGLIDAQGLGSDAHDVFATLYAHVLDVPLFVAQDDVVSALRASFTSGTSGERKRLSDARSVLAAPSAWVLHPRLLEYLRGITPLSPANGTEPPAFTAGRTLSSLFYVLSTIDAEAARLDAGDRLGDVATLRRTAQERGVIRLLQAATLVGIEEAWTATPPELGSTFVDFLTPMDRAFSSLEEGAGVFGVPEAFVPFVYDPERRLTNFEQVLEIASARLDTFAKDEAAFTAETRGFEQSSDELDREIESIAVEYDSQIESACGDAIDLDAVDWTRCGEGGKGTVGAKLLEIDQTEARVDSALGRAQAKASQIDIESRRVSEVKGIRDSTVQFTASTGEELDSNIASQGVINGLEKFVEIAAHANILNGGAPLGEAIAMTGLEALKTDLEVDRQDIQTRQDMRVQEDSAAVEVVNGEAAIKSMLVDLAQLKLETREATIAVLQARVDAENALADAKRAYAERTRALARVGTSSLRDPTDRTLLSRTALHALASRAEAQRGLFLAGRALEYHLNRPIGDALGKATLDVFNSEEAGRMKACLSRIFDDSRLALPSAQDYATEVSVRKLLGVRGPRVDEVTGERIDEGEQLRRILLRNENLDGAGSVGIELSSNLDPGNQLWASDVCDDRITQVEAQLVGDFLGDDDAAIYLDLRGGGVIRRCDTALGGPAALMSWATTGHAVIQAGVNTFGAARPNASLYGLSVASAKWRLVIPGAVVAPNNADLDLSKIEDVVLRVHHAARPIPDGPWPVSVDCLAEVGAVH